LSQSTVFALLSLDRTLLFCNILGLGIEFGNVSGTTYHFRRYRITLYGLSQWRPERYILLTWSRNLPETQVLWSNLLIFGR